MRTEQKKNKRKEEGKEERKKEKTRLILCFEEKWKKEGPDSLIFLESLHFLYLQDEVDIDVVGYVEISVFWA